MTKRSLIVRLFVLGLLGIVFVCSILLLFPNNLIITGILIILSGLVLWLNFHPRDLIIFFLAICIGTIADILSTSAGAWQFTYPTFLNIPLWIPIS